MTVASSPGLSSALFGLVLTGFGRGASFISFTYPTEIVGCHLRSTASIFIFLASGFGSFLGCVIAMVIIPHHPDSWRLYLAILATMHFVGFLLLFFISETPRYLLVSGKREKAVHVIQTFNLRKNQGVEIRPATAETRGSVLDLWLNSECFKNVVITTLLGFVIATISVGTILLFLESLQNNKAHKDCVLVESLEFEKLCKTLSADDYMLQSLSSTAMILGALLMKVIADSFGRRNSLLANGHIAIFLTSLFLFCKPKLIQTILSFNARIFLSTARVILGLYANELFPTCLRGVTSGITMAGVQLGAAVAPFIAQYLGKVNHPAAVSCFVGFAICWVVLMHSIEHETMDVSQRDLMTEETNDVRCGRRNTSSRQS